MATVGRMLGMGGQSPPKTPSPPESPPRKVRKLVKEARFGESRVLRKLGVRKSPPPSPGSFRSAYTDLTSKLTDLVRAVLEMSREHERRMAADTSSSVNRFVPSFMQELLDEFSGEGEKGEASTDTLAELLKERGLSDTTPTCKPPRPPPSDDEYEGNDGKPGAAGTTSGTPAPTAGQPSGQAAD